MTTENMNTEQPQPSSEPTPPRDAATIKNELLEVTNALIENTEWWRREELNTKRQTLYAELDALKSGAAPAKRAAGAEQPRDGEGEPEQQQPAGHGYELTVDETITGTDREEATEYAADVGLLGRDAGLSQDVTQGLFDLVADLQLTDTSGVNGCNSDETLAMLSNRYGVEAAKRLIADCQAAVKKLGPGIRQYLDQPMDAMGARLGNMPSVVIALAHLHRGDLNLTPAQAQAEITKLRQSKGYVGGDRATVDRVRVLSRIAARGQSRELKGPNQVVPSAKSQTQSATKQELTRLQADPAYIRRDHPGHKAVVARVKELYAQLYPEA